MYIFVDESGDPGSKINQGSSQHLVIALVMFADEEEVRRARKALLDLKQKINKPPSFEWKFTRLSKSERLLFLKTAAEFNFKVRAVIFKKEEMEDVVREYFKGNYYKYALRSLLASENDPVSQAIVKIDTFGEHEYRQQLKDYFLLHLGKEHGDDYQLQELIFEDSKYDELLQLADLVAGSLRRSFDNKGSRDQVYRQTFIDKEEDIRVFQQVLSQHQSF